jgi:protein ImuA
MLEQLRKTLRALEKPCLLEGEAAALPLGIESIDGVLGGGLARGALHEIAAVSEPHVTAASGFVLGLAAREHARVCWIAVDMAIAESGTLYGGGLDAFGLAPEQLLTIAAARPHDLLWAMEEALRCRAMGAVIGEWRHGDIDIVATRRLSLAAAESGALALVLRAAPASDASTAATRWIVGAAPSSPSHGGGGSPNEVRRGGVTYERSSPPPVRPRSASADDLPPPGGGERENAPRFAAHLIRNRRGPLGSWILQWSDSDERFNLAPAQPVAQSVLDRPHRQGTRRVA